ncbi:MAG: hypothetical protein HZA54_19530, partial [Planctomycetes bacterium]|nr:hypothetical protein [Planctomycetota bacterium]
MRVAVQESDKARGARGPQGRRGHTLVLVTGMLGLLSATATTFVGITTNERQTARNHVLAARARMLAEAGVERALAELRNASPAPDALGSSPLARRQVASDPRDPAAYGELQAAPAGTRPYGAAPAPLETARRISFALPTAGAPHGFAVSGVVGGTLAPASDTYALKIVECAAALHVNDTSASLGRLLDNLGDIVGVGRIHGLTFGAALLGARPRDGFRDKEEILARVFGGDAARFARVRDFLTCRAWVDPGAIRWSAAAPRWTREPRAPIDVNLAPKEVLVAVLWGLAAQVNTLDAAGRATRLAVGPIARARAEAIADQIIANRPSGRTGRPWSEWTTFSREVISRLRGLTRAEKDLLRANFDPNSNLRKLNPDRLLAEPDPDGTGTAGCAPTLIDKSDLTASSTEFCFSSMGWYEIESLGRVAVGGRAVAGATLRATVKLFDVWRATSQRDFETDRVWSDSRFGDLRGPDGIPAVVSLPEYPCETGRLGYRGAGARSSAARPGDAAWAAEYDGALLLSGICRTQVIDRPDAATFVAGFGRGRVEADCGRGLDLPAPPERALAALAAAGGGLAGALAGPAEARAGAAQVLRSVGGPAAFRDGSDLDAFGLRLDGRGRVKSYPADAWPD